MAKHFFFFSLLLAVVVVAGAGAGHDKHHSSNFIRSSCRSTQYPQVCERSLSRYASTVRRSPRVLAQTALSVSLHHVLSASSFVSNLSSDFKTVRSRQAGAVHDCMETMRDSVDRIRRSIKEMDHMGKRGSASYSYHVSNVQTWVSAALTDETTCLDSFSGTDVDPKLKAAVRRKIAAVARVTSNALALVNMVVD